jgi:nucleoside-diphosphate-sugar epimerase
VSKIIVIGGSGFIGTKLCSVFQKAKIGYIIIDKKKSISFPLKTKIANIILLKSFESFISRGSILINLAAEHRDDVTPKTLYYDTNVLGAMNVCNIARQKKIKTIIFTSSVAVYGFAEINTSEAGKISPFNEYGRTKFEAEKIYTQWQEEEPNKRKLVIIRPTVVFGEKNRGNVYNFLKQVASKYFLMVGKGDNRKSMAYVENVAAFIEYSLKFKPGIHIYNYIDKPDFTMSELVLYVRKILGKSQKVNFHLPYSFGLLIGKLFDLASFITRKKFAISSIRIKKFCANSVYSSAVEKTGFIPPVSLYDAMEKTIRYEFLEDHKSDQVFYSE